MPYLYIMPSSCEMLIDILCLLDVGCLLYMRWLYACFMDYNDVMSHEYATTVKYEMMYEYNY